MQNEILGHSKKTPTFFSLPPVRQLVNTKICASRWSCEKIFDFQFHGQIHTIFNGSGSTSQARSQHFTNFWPDFSSPSTMAMLTPKSSSAGNLYCNLCRSTINCILFTNIVFFMQIFIHLPDLSSRCFFPRVSVNISRLL